jgi:hypothetical protein
MAQIIGRQSLTLRDARGHTGRVRFFYTFANTPASSVLDAYTAVVGILAAIEAISNGAAVQIGGIASTVLNPQQYGTVTPFSTAETKLRLTYLVQSLPGGGGTLAPVYSTTHLDIPIPSDTVLLADGETVDPANGLITALSSALSTADAAGGRFCTSRGLVVVGGGLTPLIGGVLVRRRFQRKLTIWDRSANLDEPEE